MNTLSIPAKTMSSREIASLTGSKHDNVLKTVRALIKKGVISGNETPYVHEQNGQTYKEFQLNYRNTMVVVSGYSAEHRAQIIDRWQELENQQQALAIPQTLPEALRLAADLAEKNVELEHQVAEAKPKVAALDRIATADGSLCVTDAAKQLQVRPKDLFSWLQQNQWIYKRAGNTVWIGYQHKIQQGLLEHKVKIIARDDGSEKTAVQVRVLPKGLAKLSVAFNQEAAA